MENERERGIKDFEEQIKTLELDQKKNKRLCIGLLIILKLWKN